VCPSPQADGHDFPRRIDERVPGVAAHVDDIVVVGEDAVAEPVVADELPDVIDRIQLGRLWRQKHERDVFGHVELVGDMSAGLVEDEYGVSARIDGGGDFAEVTVHGVGVAPGHDEAGALSLLRTDRAEDVGRGGWLVERSGGAGAASRPTTGQLGLLTDARFVVPPQFDAGSLGQAIPDRRQFGGEVFLKSSRAYSICS